MSERPKILSVMSIILKTYAFDRYKKALSLGFLLFLAGMLLCPFSAKGYLKNTAQNICLSVNETQHAIESFGYIPSLFKMDPSGRWILYYEEEKNKPRALILLDLQTKHKWKFDQTAVSHSLYEGIAKEHYGFTQGETPFAYILQDDFSLIAQNLKTGERAVIPLKSDESDLEGFYIGGPEGHLLAVLTSEPVPWAKQAQALASGAPYDPLDEPAPHDELALRDQNALDILTATAQQTSGMGALPETAHEGALDSGTTADGGVFPAGAHGGLDHDGSSAVIGVLPETAHEGALDSGTTADGGAFPAGAHKGRTIRLDILNLDSLKTRSINLSAEKPICSLFDEDQFLFSGPSGALYRVPLFEEGAQMRKLFDPIEPGANGPLKRGQCVFVGKYQVLQLEGQFVFRKIDGSEEFFAHWEDLTGDRAQNPSLQALQKGLINWPYLFFVDKKNIRRRLLSRPIPPRFSRSFYYRSPELFRSEGPVRMPSYSVRSYHIPSGTSGLFTLFSNDIEEFTEDSIITTKDFRFDFVSDSYKEEIAMVMEDEGALQISEGQGADYLKALWFSNFPKPAGMKTLFQLNENLVCGYYMDEQNSLGFINTIFGASFVISFATGQTERHFINPCLRETRLVSLSGDSFMARHPPKSRRGQTSYKLYHIQNICFQPLDFLPENADFLLRDILINERIETPRSMALLAKALEESHPDRAQILQSILEFVFLRHPVLYLNLIRYSPSAKNFPLFSTARESGPPEDQKAQAKNSLIQILETVSRQEWSKLSDWDFIRSFSALTPLLTEEEKSYYIGRITESLTNAAALNVPLFKNVFQSKLYYTALGHVKELFGAPRQAVSDITILREEDRVSILILASDPLQSHVSQATDFGVHYALISKLEGQSLFQPAPAGLSHKASFRLSAAEPAWRSAWAGFAPAPPPRLSQPVWESAIEWRVKNAGSYRARIQIRPKPEIEDMIIDLPNKAGPDYSGAYRDGKMTGMVLIGSSLRSSSEELAIAYVNYFLEEGFLFQEPETIDLKPLLLEQIAQCEIDWFLVESHSGGNERYILRLDQFNRVLKGARPAGSDKEEIIYLVFPRPFALNPGGASTSLLSYEELSQALQIRELKGCGDLTYFNTGCWGYKKARYEIEAVGSPLFLNIPAKSMTDYFLNGERAALRILIQSYREESDFAGFRQALTANRGYSEKRRNRYLFPDEAEYFDEIIDHIKKPLSISIDLEAQREGRWQAIDPDTALSSHADSP